MATGVREAVLVSNGPGELYTWVRPVLRELRRRDPELKVSISLIPCQFASGGEAPIAESFGADAVTTPGEFLRYVATGRRPDGLGGDRGLVLSLGGNTDYALQLGARLGYPTYRYSFVPYWNRKLARLFVHDERAERQARRLGAPADRLERIGNLVADAVEQAAPAEAAGSPHVLLVPGSRDGFAIHLIPFVIALADALTERYPDARLIWPVSRLLSPATIEAGIAGREKATLSGVAGRRDGDRVIAPNGGVLEMIPENERYAHMRAADLAVTIPGTNTLELGIAGVPSVVMLPMNRPEVIPLEGLGHWLGLVPLVGRYLKRWAVRLYVEGLSGPVSLPNRMTGERIFDEVTGILRVEQVAAAAASLLDDSAERARRRERLRATMPGPGAAGRLVDAVLTDSGLAAKASETSAPTA